RVARRPRRGRGLLRGVLLLCPILAVGALRLARRLRLLAMIGGVEPRSLEGDRRRGEDLPEVAAALRAMREGVVAHLLHDVEGVAAIAASILVGGHGRASVRRPCG